MTSRADIVTLTLEVLGKVVAGEPVGDVEASIVDRRVDYAIRELEVSNVYRIQSGDDVPDEAAVPFSEYLACVCAPPFSMGTIQNVPVAQFRTLAMQRLRRLRQTETDDFSVKREYF